MFWNKNKKENDSMQEMEEKASAYENDAKDETQDVQAVPFEQESVDGVRPEISEVQPENAPDHPDFIPSESQDQGSSYSYSMPDYEKEAESATPTPDYGKEAESAPPASDYGKKEKKPFLFSDFGKKAKNESSVPDTQEKQKKKHKIRNILIGVLAGILVLIAAYFGITYAIAQAKLRTVGISSEECMGMDYMTLKESFTESGFTNIHTLAVQDLDYEELSQEGQVFFTAVEDAVSFEADDSYANDSDVIILYHSARTVTCPYSMDSCEGVSSEEIQKAFEDAGFVNVSVEKDADLIFGLLHKEGDIESITIDGTDASDGAPYRVDSEVIITYHAFDR